MSTLRNELFTFNDPRGMRINTRLALEIGLNESIVLLQLEWLIRRSKLWRDGRQWIRRGTEQLRNDEFPFFKSRATVWRTLQSLVTQELILLDDFNRQGFDRTSWIALDFGGLSKLKSVVVLQNETPEGPEQQDLHSLDDAGTVFQDETSQVEGEFLPAQGATSTSVDKSPEAPVSRNETREPATLDLPVAKRDSDAQIRDTDRANLERPSRENETALRKRDQKREQPSSGRDADSVPASSNGSAPNTATILQEVIRPGSDYPRRFKGHLAREINNLLRENIPADVVTEAARRCVGGSKPHPGNMPSLVVEVQNEKRGGRAANGRSSGFDPSTQDYESTTVR